MVRAIVVLLAVILLGACGGSDAADRGSGVSSTSVASSSSGEELLYGCIDRGTAKPLTIESAGAKLDAAVFGAGPVGLVLAHESDGSLCNWASLAPEFADEGYRVLIFDFGDPATVAQDMKEATKKIRELGAKRIVLGGASLGGTVALMTAAREPNIAAAFSLSAPAVYGNAEGLPPCDASALPFSSSRQRRMETSRRTRGASTGPRKARAASSSSSQVPSMERRFTAVRAQRRSATPSTAFSSGCPKKAAPEPERLRKGGG
jgi:pimeloyl-ACP methyl ester carboxylesterase